MEVSTKHGMARKRNQHKGYQAWCSMHARCRSDGQFAARYSARGIVVCERWATFEPFWEDMGATFQVGLTLERTDNDKGYSPDNCVWANRFTQANNTRRNRFMDTPKGRMTVSQAARAFGIPRPTISERLQRGLTDAEALGL